MPKCFFYWKWIYYFVLKKIKKIIWQYFFKILIIITYFRKIEVIMHAYGKNSIAALPWLLSINFIIFEKVSNCNGRGDFCLLKVPQVWERFRFHLIWLNYFLVLFLLHDQLIYIWTFWKGVMDQKQVLFGYEIWYQCKYWLIKV